VPGDTVVVFSDGVSEALDSMGEEFGDDRVLASIQAAAGTNAQTLVTQVFEAVRVFTAGTAQGDDITAMVIRYLGPHGAA
jgi:sigma-B regulation protein RsbU (phosphoserine phosphatase)